MKFHDKLLLVCIGCILFITVSGFKVTVKPVGDVFDNAVNFFEFEFTDMNDIAVSKSYKFDLNTNSKMKFYTQSNTNQTFNDKCFVKGDANALAGTIVTGETIFTINLSTIPIKVDHTIICPLPVSNASSTKDDTLSLGYTKKDSSTDTVKDISMNIPEKLEAPSIAIHNASIKAVRRVNNTSIQNDYYRQNLSFTFSTNVVGDISITQNLLQFVSNDGFIGNLYCYAGKKAVGRVVYSSSNYFIILSEKTNDKITCTIPVEQYAALHISPFAYLNLGFGLLNHARASIAIANPGVNNYGVLTNKVVCSTDKPEACTPSIEFEIFAGNTPSYLSQGGSIKFDFDNLDTKYVRLNTTHSLIKTADTENDTNILSKCTCDGNKILYFSNQRKGDGIIFSNFVFAAQTVVNKVKCTLFFDTVNAHNTAQGYGTVSATVNGKNKVYTKAGSTNFRFDYSPVLAVDTIRTKREDVDGADKNDIFKLDFRVYQKSHWAYTVNKPVLTISYLNSIPLTHDSIKCSSSAVSSNKMSEVKLVKHINGVSYDIPIDKKTRLLDVVFNCEVSIGTQYHVVSADKLQVAVYDIHTDNRFRASAAIQSIPIPANKDYKPDVVKEDVNSCTSVSFFTNSTAMKLTESFAKEFTDEYVKAYNKVMTTAISRDNVFFGILPLGPAKPDVLPPSFYSPFTVPFADYGSVNSALTRFAICRKGAEAADTALTFDLNHYPIYQELKGKYPQLVYFVDIPQTMSQVTPNGYSDSKCAWMRTAPTVDATPVHIPTYCFEGANCKVHGDCFNTYCSSKGKCENDGSAVPAYLPTEVYNTSEYARVSASAGLSTMLALVLSLAIVFFAF